MVSPITADDCALYNDFGFGPTSTTTSTSSSTSTTSSTSNSSSRPKLVIVRNQFGEQTLAVLKPETLCTPAEKDLVPSELGINHFKCYRVRGRGFQTRDVGLVDQFESTTATVVKPQLLCTPVDKNGEGIPDPVNHLTCYRLSEREPFAPRDVTVVDQFAEQNVPTLGGQCRKVDLLCVPSTKEVIAAP